MESEAPPNEDLIEYIVSTYNLPHKLEDKIIRITTEQIHKFYIHNFNDAYEYISNLVEKFKIPFRERTGIRGDKPINPDSGETFFDLIGAEDSILTNLFEESKGFSRTKSLDEIIYILESSLDKSDIELMRRSFNCNLSFYVREEDIIAKANEIGERFRELIGVYGRKGKLIIPKRPIAQIQFNPLSIKFRNRKYHGNPLAFFEKHKDVYGGMSRSELASVDSSLYVTLLKTKQLSIAIPECKNRNYHGNPLAFFNEHKDIYSGMSRGELYAFDKGLYSALWREKQLHITIPERRRMKYGKNALAFFNEHKDIYGEMSKTELFHFDRGLYTALKRNNQLHVIKDRNVLSKKEIEDIIDMYHACGGNASLICRELNRNHETVTKYLGKRGLKPSGRLRKAKI